MTPPSSGAGRHRAAGAPSTPPGGFPETSGSSAATAGGQRATGTGAEDGSGASSSRGPKPGGGVALRVVAAVVLVLAWLAGSGVGGPMFGQLSEVSSNCLLYTSPSPRD